MSQIMICLKTNKISPNFLLLATQRMKNKIPVLVILIMMQFHWAFSQKIINEASFKYDIAIETSENNSLRKSFEGAYIYIFLRSEKSRTDLITKLGQESALYDNAVSAGTILKEYSGQKLMITLTKEDWEEKFADFQGLIFSNTGEEKTINGYECKKAIAKLNDGDEVVVFYAPDLVLKNKTYSYAFSKLNGLPIMFELTSLGLKFKYLLSSISYEPVSVNKFEVSNISQYRVISYKEAVIQKKGN